MKKNYKIKWIDVAIDVLHILAMGCAGANSLIQGLQGNKVEALLWLIVGLLMVLLDRRPTPCLSIELDVAELAKELKENE